MGLKPILKLEVGKLSSKPFLNLAQKEHLNFHWARRGRNFLKRALFNLGVCGELGDVGVIIFSGLGRAIILDSPLGKLLGLVQHFLPWVPIFPRRLFSETLWLANGCLPPPGLTLGARVKGFPIFGTFSPAINENMPTKGCKRGALFS